MSTYLDATARLPQGWWRRQMREQPAIPESAGMREYAGAIP